MTAVDRFHPDLARDWKFYRYPDARIVALEPPPCDVRITRELVASAARDIFRMWNGHITIVVENCTAIYRIDVEDDLAFGCCLEQAQYEHHTLPPR